MKALYPLNVFANAVLGIGAQCFEPVEDDVPTDSKDAREASYVDEDEIEMDKLPDIVGGDPILPAAMDDD